MTRSAVKSVAIKQSLGVETFDDRREQREAARDALKLTPAEREDLEELWGGLQASLGMRSVQGAIQDRLRRSPPRDEVRIQVVQELDRAGGRAPEGKVLRIVIAEGASRYEAKRAVQMLVLWEHVVRVDVEMPVGHESKKKKSDGTDDVVRGLSDAQAEWTGFDLRLTKKARGELAERFARRRAMTDEAARRARWKAQDEALEAECQMIHCSDAESFSPYSSVPELAPWRSAKVTRATMALQNTSPMTARVLHALIAGRHPGEDEEKAVARIVGVGLVQAGKLIGDAFADYKSARREVVAWLAR